MAQSTDIREYSNKALLEKFRSKTECVPGSSGQNYAKAIASLSAFIAGQSVKDYIATTQFLENWFIFMFLRGLTVKTSLHYFDIVAGLYNTIIADKENETVFKEVKARIKQLAPDKWRQIITNESFKRFLNLIRLADRQSGETALYTDILLFSLLNRGMDLSEVATLKCSDIDRFSQECREIAARHISPRRKYVFPLDQTKYTPRQLNRLITNKLNEMFNSRNIINVGNIQESIRSYWAYGALTCGYSAGTIISVLGRRPIGVPIFALCSTVNDISSEQKQSVTDSITALFVGNPLNWYAMRLRPGVKFDRLLGRIDECKGRIIAPELFYPCKEIAKRIKRKLVFEQKPVIPDIVFFKSRVTDIRPLFWQIGDLAWCYMTGETYASIPQKAMEAFQKAIGKFTPDYEVGPIGSIVLRPGDRIVAVGGSFTGKEGEIIDSSLNENGVIYRIMLWGDQNNIEWRVNDSRLIEKKQS